MVIAGFASLTMLTRNSFLNEIRKDYVRTARSKGLSERQVLYGHVFRNAMLLVIAGLPGAFINIFFAGSMLIEVDLLDRRPGTPGVRVDPPRATTPSSSRRSASSRYLGLVVNLVSDFIYTLVDPRIDFESREV